MGSSVPYPDPTIYGRAATSEHALSDPLTVTLVCMGALSLGSWWKYKDLRAPYWRLYLNRTDGAEIQTKHGTLRLQGSRIYLIPAHLSYSPQSTPGVEHIFVHFDLPGIPAELTQEIFDRPQALSDETSRTQRLIAIGDALALGTIPHLLMLLQTRMIVDSCLTELISKLSAQNQDRLSATLLHRGRLAPVLATIEADPCSPHPNAALARLAGISTDHLIRLFRRHLGVSPSRYVCERRLTAAARSLAFGKDSIENIAKGHGFANRFGFTRAFTRRFGCGPAAWRDRGGA